MHEAVAAEAHGAVEAFHAADVLADYGVVVGGDGVEAAPAAHEARSIEHWRTVGGLVRHLYQEFQIEVGVEAGRLLMVGHAHQYACPLPPEVETGGKVNDHGDLLGQLVEGRGNEDLTTIGHDGQLQAGQTSHLGRPRPGDVDHHRGRDLSRAGHHRPHLPLTYFYVQSFGFFADLHPQTPGLPGEAHGHAVGIGVAIARAEGAPHHIVQMEIGGHVADLLRRQQAHRHARALLHRHVGLELGPVPRLCGQEQVAMLAEVNLRLELLGEVFKGPQALQGDADIGFRGELQSDSTGR